MKKILFIIAAFFLSTASFAQNFIDKATIEYEVKTNIKKTMGSSSWEEMMKDNLPTFKTGYYTFTFADNKSIYKFDHWIAGLKLPEWYRNDDEANRWFYDHKANALNIQKSAYGTVMTIQDSIPELKWKISNETQVIAGFNCKKATAIIFDSVYVFAFYTDEIMISGGPCSISGLPGQVLGLTIPRLYTSWIATKVSVNNVDLAALKATTVKKPFTRKSQKDFIEGRMDEWWGKDDLTAEDRLKKNVRVWTLLL